MTGTPEWLEEAMQNECKHAQHDRLGSERAARAGKLECAAALNTRLIGNLGALRQLSKRCVGMCISQSDSARHATRHRMHRNLQGDSSLKL